MEENKDGIIPLGLCKQAAMKLESFVNDINEIREDDDVDEADKEMFAKMADVAGTMLAAIVNVVHKECGEDDFINEEVPMDPIDSYPGDNPVNLLDEEIE